MTSAIAAIGPTTPSMSLFLLTANTTCSRSHRKNSPTAVASASAPAGLCAPSTTTGGSRTTISSRPGGRSAAGPSRDTHPRGLPPDDLEPAGGAKPREPLPQHALLEDGTGERLERDGARCGVPRRVAPEHGHVQVLIRSLRRAKPERLATDGDQRVEDLPVLALPQKRR